MYCEELVCSVSNNTTFVVVFVKFSFYFSDRCQGYRKDLDGELSQIPRSRELTERLVEDSLVKTLWDDYGIVADTVVCIRYFLFRMVVNSIQYPAFYK
jgi:hypothetical protein